MKGLTVLEVLVPYDRRVSNWRAPCSGPAAASGSSVEINSQDRCGLKIAP